MYNRIKNVYEKRNKYAVKGKGEKALSKKKRNEVDTSAAESKKPGFFGKVREMAAGNVLYIVYTVCMVTESLLLRCFTVGLGESRGFAEIAKAIYKPMLADIFAVMVLGAFGFLFRRQRGRFAYLMVLTSVFSFLTFANAIYYKNFKSFVSFSFAKTGGQLGGVVDAVTNLLEVKHFVLLFPFIVMPVTYSLIKKVKGKEYVLEKQTRKRCGGYAGTALSIAVISGVLFASMLTTTDCSRLVKQWNRESVMSSFGMYVYQISDAVSCIHAKVNLMFGYEESKKKFDEFFESTADSSAAEIKNISSDSAENEGGTPAKEKTDGKNEKANEYTDIFKGKNVIVIHCESMQQFCLDTYFNGEPVAPNLQRLAKEGLYFSNFYTQESVGTSSDSEFTFSSSLMPASSGTVAINYWDRDYATTQKKFKEMGYYVYSMHANNGSYWNRLNLHASLGYDRLYNYTNDFDIDEVIGLGLSDKSFFRQAVPIMKDIDQNNDNWYAALIMLTNHTPFTDIERVSDYEVNFKFKQYNDETGMYEEITRKFLEGKKLGSYFKSAHYADEALGQLIDDLDSQGLLDDTVLVLYGDHDAKIKEEQYEYYYNYDPFSNKVLTNDDDGYVPVDEFYYNLNRKTPFIIWTKDHEEYEPKEITEVMGMYDVQPTLGNMFGFENQYALGHDIFSVDPQEGNIVIFPNGNFITDKIYYDSQKEVYFDLEGYENVAVNVSCNQVYKDSPDPLFDETTDGLFKFDESPYSENFAQARKDNGVVDNDYISERARYVADRIDVSNSIIYYDIINKIEDGFDNNTPQSTDSAVDDYFAPPDTPKRRIHPV